MGNLVFISHGVQSLQDGGLAFENVVLDRLYSGLLKPAEPFLDRNVLRAGDIWDESLNWALGRCRAAVIYLTSRSIQREWVKKEATILAWRASRRSDDRFNLHILRSKEVSDESLKSSDWGAININEFQCHRLTGDHSQDFTIVDLVVKDLVAFCTEIEEREQNRSTPFGIFLEYIENHLSDINPSALESMAKDLTGQSIPATSPSPIQRECLQAISRELYRFNFGSIGNFFSFMRRLERCAVSLEKRRNLLKSIAPLRIELGRAALLGCQETRRFSPTTVRFTPSDPSYADCEFSWIAKRAMPHPAQPCVIQVAPPSDLEEEAAWADAAMFALSNKILTRCKRRKKYKSEQEAVRDLLPVHPDPIFLLLPEDADISSLEEISHSLENIQCKKLFLVFPQSIEQEPDSDFTIHIHADRNPDEFSEYCYQFELESEKLSNDY